MGLIYVLAPDGNQELHEENQVRELLRQRALSPDAYYWKDGMADWRPLRELPPATPKSSLFSGKVTSTTDALAKNLVTLSLATRSLLIVSFLIAGLNLLPGIAVLILLQVHSFKTIVTVSHFMVVFGYLSLTIFLITSVPFLMWIYRASSNCHSVAKNLTISPGMSVGGYFIPIGNLVYPCIAMQEIWKASRNPAEWQTEKNAPLVGFWWGFWLLTSVLGQVVMFISRKGNSHDVEAISAHLQNIALSLITLETSKMILCVLAFCLVHYITESQRKLPAPVPRQ